MRTVIGVTLHGVFGAGGNEVVACLVGDPDEPQLCEGCPQGTAPHALFIIDEDGISTCMLHSFENVEAVEYRELTT